MHTRHLPIAIAALAIALPALAQDTPAPMTSAPAALRATGAYPTEQDTSQWLGSNLIGARVVGANNETIGRIANLVINENGAVEAVVIAIGGVLGMGAKEVAVTYRSLNIVRSKGGDAIDHITLAASRNDLRFAADFKTLREQKARR
jgi:hypothetical protein